MTNPFDTFVKDTKELVLKYPVRHVHEHCKFYAVIVEPRIHPNFEYVCKNVLRFTDEQWGLHIFHGKDNEAFVKQCLNTVSNVKYTNLEKGNLTIHDYNKLMTSNDRYHTLIDSEVFLVFQTDSCLLREGINEFVQYDYVAAPWCESPTDRGGVVFGNGGLSLRNKDMCMRICNKYEHKTESEDMYYSIHMRTEMANLPTRDKASEFSIENCTCEKHIPVGIHQRPQNVNHPDFMKNYIEYFQQ